MQRTQNPDALLARLPTLDLEPLTLRGVQHVGERYTLLRVDASGHPLATGYERPGQFVALRTPEESVPRYFVLASAPQELPAAEFLVTRTDEHPGGLVDARPGERILGSPVMGEGYAPAVDEAQALVALVTGAGIAAVRPLVRAWLACWPERAERLRIFYGEAAPCRHAFADDLAAWKRRGAQIEMLCDCGPTEDPVERFVQAAWAGSTTRRELQEAHFVVCGAPVMQEAATALLHKRDVPQERIHFNW